jgi:solute carrier family 32 (vesicular inhibitory amino acid transporter)
MITTSTAVVFIIVGSTLDYDTCYKERGMPSFHVQDYFLAFATITFAYGGHSAFPTIQHDMKKPAEFVKSTTMAFLSRIYGTRDESTNRVH